MMIIDLIDAEISYECESNTDGEIFRRIVQPIRHPTKEKWAIFLAAEVHEASNEDLIYNHVDSTTRTLIKLHSDNDIWMIPLTFLVEPCFVIYTKKYCEQGMYNKHTDDRTAYVVNPMSMWGNVFLEPLL